MQDFLVRVRFAPSPTGLMHLGNVRTALMNYLFARQKNGAFILRIEDTDPSRNVDPEGKKIINDLLWLGLNYDEGPIKDGPYSPYFQSERTAIYQEQLQALEEQQKVYRCFCTSEELEKKRQRQISLKLPPRYDRTCSNLAPETIEKNLEQKTPFIWRIRLEPHVIKVHDLARGTIQFDLRHFSDFPLTRQDGSFTFMFANFVDDAVMHITHVLRGEDHISNTAGQAALYQMLHLPIPTFWHLPVLCNAEGKKLSKRDFGFSLGDLKENGFLPEAIINYLAIVGGGTFEQEIMSLEQLIQTLNFDTINPTSHVRYDVSKLTWVNHKWIDRYDPEQLTRYAQPFIEEVYPEAKQMDQATITNLIQTVKTDIETLKDIPHALRFYFEEPTITQQDLMDQMHTEQETVTQISAIINKHLDSITDPDTFIKQLKDDARKENIPLQKLFSFLRLSLMNSIKGPSIHDLITMLGIKESEKRIKKVL